MHSSGPPSDGEAALLYDVRAVVPGAGKKGKPSLLLSGFRRLWDEDAVGGLFRIFSAQAIGGGGTLMENPDGHPQAEGFRRRAQGSKGFLRFPEALFPYIGHKVAHGSRRGQVIHFPVMPQVRPGVVQRLDGRARLPGVAHDLADIKATLCPRVQSAD